MNPGNHVRKPGRTIAFGIAVGFLALAWSVALGLETALADLGDGHTRAQRVDVFEPRDDEKRPGRITRNLATGSALVVCSEDFPMATEDAVKRWNDQLGRAVLAFEGGEEACSKLKEIPEGRWEPEDGVVAVFVTVGVTSGLGFDGPVVGETCSSRAIACVRQDGVDSTYRTRYGRLEVTFKPERFCRDVGAQPTEMCSIDDQPVGQETDNDLRYVLAHELGHALSLGDYYCQLRDSDNPDNETNRHPDFIDVPTLMNTFAFSTIDLRRTCNSPDGSPTPRDVSDYRTIYLPAAVSAVEGKASDQTVTLTWDQSRVFVEEKFEIQRLDATTWIEVADAPANAVSVEVGQQPGGRRSYRVVGRTKALSSDQAGHEHAHGPADEQVSVTVRFLAPANPRVATPGSSSLKFEWDEVDGADGYDVRIRETTENNCKIEPDQKATATGLSSPFTGLKASTTYLLCVRATLAGHPDATSDWAPLSKMTAAQRVVPPPQPPDPPQPCAGKQRPDDFTTPPATGTSVDRRWGPPTFVSPSFCVEYEEERTTTVTAYASVTYSCDGTCWVANVKVITSEHVGNWTRTGNIRQCNFGPSSAGQSATLSAGDYELQWGERRVAFTVPAGTSVTLQWREQQGGGYAAVLSTKDGVELVLSPPTPSGAAQGQAQAVEASVPNDPTLVAVAASMRNPATAQTSTVTKTTKCAVAEPSVDGTTSVDLDADSCAVVRQGGAVTVGADGQSRSFALPEEQEWLIVDATESSGGGAAAVTLLHIASGAYITLALSDGTELGRHVPDGESEVASLFNTLASATSASGGD